MTLHDINNNSYKECNACVINNHLSCLKNAYKCGYKWNDTTYLLAIKHTDCFNYML